MFTLEELNYILLAIQTMPINSTDEARSKANMTFKVANLMDQVAAPPEKKEPATPSGTSKKQGKKE